MWSGLSVILILKVIYVQYQPCNHPSRVKLHTLCSRSHDKDTPFWLDSCMTFALTLTARPSLPWKVCDTVSLQLTLTWETNALFTIGGRGIKQSVIGGVPARFSECWRCHCSVPVKCSSGRLHEAAAWMTAWRWRPGRAAARRSPGAHGGDHQRSPQADRPPEELGLPERDGMWIKPFSDAQRMNHADSLTSERAVHQLSFEAVEFGHGANGGQRLQGPQEPLLQKGLHQSSPGPLGPGQGRTRQGQDHRTLADTRNIRTYFTPFIYFLWTT